MFMILEKSVMMETILMLVVVQRAANQLSSLTIVHLLDLAISIVEMTFLKEQMPLSDKLVLILMSNAMMETI